MNKSSNSYFFFVCLVSLLLNCSPPKELSPDKYLEWVGKEKNGLVKFKTIQNVKIMVRYLPAELLAYREWKELNKPASYDSILNSYKCGIVFQLSIQADKQDVKYGNLMYYNVSGQNEVIQRIEYLNFNIESILSIEHGGLNYRPVLSHFEGFDQIRNQVNFQVSFIIPEFDCGNIKPDFQNLILVFQDQVWDLGKNNFEFKRASLFDIQKINLLI
jgi:hypothetical protein